MRLACDHGVACRPLPAGNAHMAIGPTVRRLFGPYEGAVADHYRSLFLDISDLIDVLSEWTRPSTILEVGCGEGAVTERLAAAFPDARITAIDITDRIGRLYGGDPSRVVFEQRRVDQIAEEQPGCFDLVLINDVLHHVPRSMQADFLGAAGMARAPSGWLVLKDWVRGPTAINWLCYFCDRYVTGDRIYYAEEAELRGLLAKVYGEGAIRAERHIRPWRHNLAFLIGEGSRRCGSGAMVGAASALQGQSRI